MKVEDWTFTRLCYESYSNSYIYDTSRNKGNIKKIFQEKKDVILDPSPFRVNSLLSDDLKKLSDKENVTESQMSDAKEVANILNLDLNQVLNLIIQICKRFPEYKEDQKRLLFYCDSILQEKRTVGSIFFKFVYSLSSVKNRCENESDRAFYTITFDGIDIFEYTVERIETIEKLMKNISHNVKDSQMESIIFNDNVLFLVISLRNLCELIALVGSSKSVIQAWFHVMKAFKFSNDLEQMINDLELYIKVKSFVSCISFQLMNGGNDLNMGLPCYFDPQLFFEINDIVTNVFDRSAVIDYSWILVQQRIKEKYPDIGENFSVLSCPESKLVDELTNIKRYIGRDHELSSKIVSSLVENIGHSKHLDLPPLYSSSFEDFNSVAREKECAKAKMMFPAKISPYLNLIEDTLDEFSNPVTTLERESPAYDIKYSDTFAIIFGDKEFQRLFEFDGSDSSKVILKESYENLPPYEKSRDYLIKFEKGDAAIHIPGSEHIVVFRHRFNVWQFMVRTLWNVTTLDNWNKSEAQDILSIVGVLNDAAHSDHGSADIKILSDVYGTDTTECLLNLFQYALSLNKDEVYGNVLSLLLSGWVNERDKLWSFLFGSSFLSSQRGKSSSLLEDDVLADSLVLRLSGLIYHLEKLSDGKHAIDEIIEYFMAVHESLNTMEFELLADIVPLHWSIICGFQEIINTPDHEASNEATEMLSYGREKVLKKFLTTYKTPLISPIMNILDIFNENLKDISLSVYAKEISYYEFPVTLNFYKDLILMRSSNNMEPSALEMAFFEKLPVLVSLYAREIGQHEILELLEALLTAKWENRPSLLKYLGRHYLRVLRESLVNDLDSPFIENEHVKSFIFSIMETRQEGVEILGIENFDTL